LTRPLTQDIVVPAAAFTPLPRASTSQAQRLRAVPSSSTDDAAPLLPPQSLSLSPCTRATTSLVAPCPYSLRICPRSIRSSARCSRYILSRRPT
jgi:hypothetical protein